MKKAHPKLSLKSETLRNLSDGWLSKVKGGLGGPRCPILSCDCNETTSTADTNCPSNYPTLPGDQCF